jgi:hypothetical protein
MSEKPILTDADEIISKVMAACAFRVEAEPPRDYLGMSEIGHPCEKRLYMKYQKMPGRPIDGRLARVFDMGHAVESRVIADLTAAGYRVEDRQLAFADFDDRFQGHCDGVILNVTGKPHVLEIKSANHESFRDFQAHGLRCRPVYEAQIHCYMGYSGLVRALFMVENKNNQEIYAERVHFDPGLFQGMRDKAWRILNSDGREYPQCEPEDVKCYFCEYKNGVYVQGSRL